jgi:hypothetical protein
MPELGIYSQKTKKLFERHGLRCMPGSQIATSGKNPDLFCESPSKLWIEVKHIGAPNNFEIRLPRIMNTIQQYADTLDAKGTIFIYTTLNSNDRDVKLAKQAIHRFRDQINNLRDKKYIIITIPQRTEIY